MVEKYPIHCEFTITFNRFTLMQRSLYHFLNDKYQGRSILLIFNTGKSFELGHFDIPPNKEIILINDQETDFNSVGEKYNKALIYLPEEVETVNLKDEDDSTLDHHIQQGVTKLLESGKSAWKPSQSYFHHNNQLTLQSNVFEGSIFMKADHLRKYKFHSDKSVKYHDAWLHPLVANDDIIVDPTGIPSFLYDWSNPSYLGTYKMSGRLESQANYETSKIEAKDFGTGVLIPSSKYIINDI